MITTNDNVDALRFCRRRGFRLAELRAGAVDDSRAQLNPEIPAIGDHGIPLRDEIELERNLQRRLCPAGARRRAEGPGTGGSPPSGGAALAGSLHAPDSRAAGGSGRALSRQGNPPPASLEMREERRSAPSFGGRSSRSATPTLTGVAAAAGRVRRPHTDIAVTLDEAGEAYVSLVAGRLGRCASWR